MERVGELVARVIFGQPIRMTGSPGTPDTAKSLGEAMAGILALAHPMMNDSALPAQAEDPRVQALREDLKNWLANDRAKIPFNPP